MPSCSSARRRSESVRGLMPEHECSSSEKRRGPSERSWTRIAVHFAPTISAHAATEQDVASCTAFIVRMWRILLWRVTERSRRGFELRDREARDRPEAARRRLARLGYAGVAGDREEDERVLDREAVLVDEEPGGLLAHELQRVVVVVRGGVRDPAVAELRHRPRRLLALQDVEAHGRLARDLDAGEADLAVAHRRVHVADGEHPALLPHREVDARALAVQVVVEVAAVPPRKTVGERVAVGRHADDADHWLRRKADALVHLD